jgi:hypothetical protein
MGKRGIATNPLTHLYSTVVEGAGSTWSIRSATSRSPPPHPRLARPGRPSLRPLVTWGTGVKGDEVAVDQQADFPAQLGHVALEALLRGR